MNPPKISVLIPTYNYARFLPEAIESVLAQDFADFELLIVDDCSADNTAAVVQPFCARDARVRFSVNAANLGLANNWNHCLDQARGEYIKFLFGDDKLCHSQALGKMIALLERHSSATLAAAARVILDEKSKVVDVYQDLAEGCHNGRKIITACLMENGKNLVGEPSAVLFRKSDARRGFDARHRQIVDVEMWFHLLEKGDLAYTREPLCAFRCHPLQQTERNTDSGVAWKEHAVFISSLAVQLRFPRKVVFPILFHLRHSRRKSRDAASPEMSEWQRRLAARWGGGWRWFYWVYCLRYRIAKPFHNLIHSVQKRLFRRSFKPTWVCSSRPESSARSGSSNDGGKPA
ncbi:MAG: glycosyltransferase family 2 protein [Limisphaerales bacterium]